MSWIKCSHEMPVEHDDVLVTAADAVPVVAYLRMIGTWNDSENHCELDWEPTHWQPLPEPPKDD